MRRRRSFRLLPSGLAASPRVAWLSMVAMTISIAAATAFASEVAIANSAFGGKEMTAVEDLSDL